MTQDSDTKYPQYAVMYKPGTTIPFESTMNKATMDFYAKHGCRIEPLVEAKPAMEAIIAARAMMTIYQQCFARANSARPGDKVVFDNGLFPLTPQEEHVLMNAGIMIGQVYTVDTVYKAVGRSVEITFQGSNPHRRFTASKFSILPK